MSQILAFRNVAWAPPGRNEPVFTGLDLELGPGETTVLTSGLGGGKSSALRLAVGLETPSAGSIAICGGSPAEARGRIGYVGGEGALLANLSLYDNLVLPLRWLRDPPPREVEARAREVLELFAIEDLPAVAPAYAPTNLRRLVALARAMIMEPKLLVLDDPAADFDGESAAEVWQHLAHIASSRGIAILAAATAPPTLASVRIVALSGTAVPATRRFSPSQRRSSEQVPVRGHAPVAVHPDIIARKHP